MNIVGILILLGATVIWGSTVAAQSIGMDYIGPFTFQACRNALGVLALLPVIIITDLQKIKRRGRRRPQKHELAKLLKGGLLCGLALFAACNLQQIGIKYSTAAKSGFITAMYILLVPLFGIFVRKKTRLHTWLCALIAAVGLYLLSMNESFTISAGDLYLLGCAAAYAVHILIVDRFAKHVDLLKLSLLQMITASLLSGVMMFIFESPSVSALYEAKWTLLYAGVLSSGIAYTLQIVAQKFTDPSAASLAMSLESVFALLAGIVVLAEIPTVREFVGCALMFAAIILAQLLDSLYLKRQKKKEMQSVAN